MKTIRVTIILETKRGSGEWISEEVDAIPLTQHFCLARDKPFGKRSKVTRTFTHIPTGWRLTDQFRYTKKVALPKAKALEKLPVNWDSTDTKDYANIPKDIMAQIYAIIYPEGKSNGDSSLQIG